MVGDCSWQDDHSKPQHPGEPKATGTFALADADPFRVSRRIIIDQETQAEHFQVAQSFKKDRIVVEHGAHVVLGQVGLEVRQLDRLEPGEPLRNVSTALRHLSGRFIAPTHPAPAPTRVRISYAKLGPSHGLRPKAGRTGLQRGSAPR
jgi:hypothetical protein